MRQVRRIVFVAAVLEPLVPFDRRRVRQMHSVPRRLQRIHQPVPVVRRFNHHANQLFSVRCQQCKYRCSIIRHPPPHQYPVHLVAYNNDAVVRMQINSAIFHLRPPLGYSKFANSL
jgi:hypothetical protein